MITAIVESVAVESVAVEPVAVEPVAVTPVAPATPEPPGADVLACYLALDTSDSMSGPALDAVGTQLARLWDAVRTDPRLAACRVAVVTFDAEARVHLPLTRPGDLARPPRPAATRPATNYEAVFTLLHELVVQDAADLRAAGLRPLRPVVFLLTDGRPTRGYWPPAHAALTERGRADAPDVVAFGFGDAAEVVVRRIGTAGAYLPVGAAGGAAHVPAGLLATATSFLLESLAGRSDGASAGARSPGAGDGDEGVIRDGNGAGCAREVGRGDDPPLRAPSGWRTLS